jgi:hypothetical protein
MIRLNRHRQLLPVLAALIWLVSTAFTVQAADFSVKSDLTMTDVKYPESVAYDERRQVLYVSEFGSKLQPTLADGQGYISKVSTAGIVLEKRFLPGPGITLNKPKGLWVDDDRLWVTDIDGVWVFDLKTKVGRKILLPGVQFANDLIVMKKTLLVSDNRGDQVFKVEPADFLDAKAKPTIERVFRGKSVYPNGLYPSRGKDFLAVGFKSPSELQGIYEIDKKGNVEILQNPFGRLDGLYRLDDGTLLLTDWNTGSLLHWRGQDDLAVLARGFSGPADFAVVPKRGGYLIIVPDLVASNLRLIEIED